MKDWGYEVIEKRMTIQELKDLHEDGKLEEAFATGTAAVISPIGTLGWNGEDMIINRGEIGELSQKLYDSIASIQYGKSDDKFGWITKL
jgi:branched-chain amino acid aminotransferase